MIDYYSIGFYGIIANMQNKNDLSEANRRLILRHNSSDTYRCNFLFTSPS